MYLHVKQIRNYPTAEYEAGEYYCEAPTVTGPWCAFLSHGNNLLYVLRAKVWGLLQSPRGVRNLAAVEDSAGREVGSVYIYRTPGFFAEMYLVLNINGEEYKMYPVGLGKQGIKAAIYNKAGVQIAQIDKGTRTYNMLDEYDVYVSQADFADLAMLFCIYYDIVYHRNNGVISKGGASVLYVWSNRKYRRHYNPDFVKGIKD